MRHALVAVLALAAAIAVGAWAVLWLYGEVFRTIGGLL